MRIAVYAFDGITLFHLSIPQMVFGTVSRLGLADWQVSLFTTASESATPPEETVAPEEGASPPPPTAPSRTAAIRTSEGYILDGLGGPELASEADVVVVPAWFVDGRPAGEELCSLLKTAHARGGCVVGLCLGAIPLAEAGLIGGRRAVTHWRAFEPLAREHPEIALDESVLYVDHGDVLTSAGAASGLDACLHLVRKYVGAQAANEVARQLVIAPHREGGQAQYIERPVPRHADDDPIGSTASWALEHLGEPLPVERLARNAQMSTRSFIRAFRESTDAEPGIFRVAPQNFCPATRKMPGSARGRLHHPWYDSGMTQKIAVSLPDEQVVSIRRAVAQGRAASVSGFVSAAVARAQREDNLAQLLDDLDRELGPVDDADLAWADKALGLV